MKLKYYTVAICSFLAINSFAQTKDSTGAVHHRARMTADKTPASAKPTDSTSTAKVSHKMQDSFIGFGFVLGPSSDLGKVLYGQSREFIAGLGTGYKFAKWNGVGIDVYYKSTDFYIKQDDDKILPNSIQHSSEKISLNNFGGLIFDRFYFKKSYIDAGFYFDWAFYSKHITWDKDTSASGGSTIKTIQKQLTYVNPTNYGLTFRFGGAKGLSFYFNYRLSKVFKSDFSYPEMPPAILGVVIGMH